jgi:electron transport complex protein RnfD
MPVIGSFVAVAIGKQVFGGLGYNIFNPALVGRAFILAAWPGKATSFTGTISWGAWVGSLDIRPASWAVDSISTATPLTLLKLQGQATPLLDLIIGNIPGSLGETSAVAILLGAAYLLYKGTISWHVPASFVGTVVLLSLVLGENPVFHVFAGGLFLGAFFMATDVVTSPVTKLGRIVFGAGAGAVTLLIRIYGAYPEGVCYSILLMNALTPLIDRYTFRTSKRSSGEVCATKGEQAGG